MKPAIQKTAIVKNSQIGDNTKIWEFANIYECKIGFNCNIGSYVEIQSNATIGSNVTISSHSFICSLVHIEDDVFIGHGVMTINDINPPSYKKTGNKNQYSPFWGAYGSNGYGRYGTENGPTSGVGGCIIILELG